jgi:two-component system chemotaxis sensor kinase CheA
MSMDLDEFHEMFFEESLEALDDMESNLLNLDVGNPDIDAINTIFRGAHSVKGGSGMFGFTEITGFTHILETLLDKVRVAEKKVTQSLVDQLLHAVDCLRDMLRATQAQAEFDTPLILEIQQGLEEALTEDAAPEILAVSNHESSEPSGEVAADTRGWRVKFRPHEHMLASANDPARIFQELRRIGNITTHVDVGGVPSFRDLDPEQCFLTWVIDVETASISDEVRDAFEWVEYECDLSISALESAVAERPCEPLAASVTTPAIASSDPPVMVPDAPKKDFPTDPPKFDVGASEKKSSPQGTSRQPVADSGSIRVGIDKIDLVINLVGELVITQSMLRQFGEEGRELDRDGLREGLNALERHTRELQQTIMQIRMLPISFSFNRFPRLVRDISGKLGKKIELRIAGENTELDKTVLEKIGDPLVHLVRNSLDHGIELPEERLAAGKPEIGVLELNAYHAGGNIVIEVKDDGRGLPREKLLQKARSRGIVGADEELTTDQIHNLIFHPGFSTADEVSEISGRGVGMDVVRRNIKDLGGIVEIESEEGKGCSLRVRLPLTLAILDGQLVSVGKEIFVISLVSIVESIQLSRAEGNAISKSVELYRVRGEYIPIIRLHECFSVRPNSTDLSEGLLVVVESEGTRVGLFVDDLLSQQQVVIKSLETNFRKVPGLSGATILGDGTVALIIDVPGLVSSAQENARPRNAHATRHVA